ncbi:hypothetical protein ACN6MY_03795 [Peribacillus sp. B-H-3]|uniref:hypothetical protein n=1 Tax=Peribacillus sp. B-H-3 TaxID=3400420 RepID=UPI003B01B768
MIEKHEQVINENILPRLEGLEMEHAHFKQEMASLKTDLMGVQKGQVQLEKGQKDLELTVVKEGQASRDIMNENKAFTKKLLDHVLRKDEKETQAVIDRTKQKWELFGKISLAIFGAGGLLVVIVQAFQ